MDNFKNYIEKFNSNDEEIYVNKIDNANAYDFLLKNAPKLSCPDKIIEETFAFRTWVYRKHIRQGVTGVVISEFLPEVSWADADNTISTAFPFHLDEGRWFACDKDILQYVDFMLKNKGNSYHYKTPAIFSIVGFLRVSGNEWYIKENIELFENYFQGWDDRHLLPCGLYWSEDWNDAMEYSISGTSKDNRIMKGIRPTLNSYMYGDAVIMSELEDALGRTDKANFYRQKALTIKKLTEERLWDGTFYKAVHTRKEYRNVGKSTYLTDPVEPLNLNDLSYKDILPDNNAKELIGYIPWIYKLAPNGREEVFNLLKDPKTFAATTGFSTADISHERFLYERSYHECFWNGYVWPFATTQTINAVISLLNNYKQSILNERDLYDFIEQYAKMHYLTENGKTVNFIDEMMHPFKHEWTTREIMKAWNWLTEKGGYERGKDYNHSSFIDLVIRGLIGVDDGAEELSVRPKIKGIWKWFKLSDLSFKHNIYDIYYDEDGSVFNKGKGLIIEKHA